MIRKNFGAAALFIFIVFLIISSGCQAKNQNSFEENPSAIKQVHSVGLGTNLKVFEDPDRPVTCWLITSTSGEAIYCIPNKELR